MASVLWVVWSRTLYPGALKPGFLFHQTVTIFAVLVFPHKIFSYYERPLSHLSSFCIHDSAVLSTYSGSPSQQPFTVAPADLCVHVIVCKFRKTNIPAVCSTGPMDAHELSLVCAVPLMLPTQPWELSVLASQSIFIMVISGI